jgi:hypothetical protein
MHKYAAILQLLLRLRQACDHPFLVLGRPVPGAAASVEEPMADDAPAGDARASADVIPAAFVKLLYEKFRNASGSAARATPPGPAGTAAAGTGACDAVDVDADVATDADSKASQEQALPVHVREVLRSLQVSGVAGHECPVCIDVPVGIEPHAASAPAPC